MTDYGISGTLSIDDVTGKMILGVEVNPVVSFPDPEPEPDPTLQGLFVSPSGHDANNGSEATPFKTIQRALNVVSPGEIAYLRNGIYNESATILSSGTVSEPIGIKNYPGESPIMEWNSSVGNWGGFYFGGDLPSQKEHIHLEGLEIRGYYYDGVKLYNGVGCQVTNCHIHHNKAQGILGRGRDCRFKFNRISNNGRADEAPSHWHGIYFTGARITIERNLIHNNTGWCVQVASYPDDMGLGFGDAHDWKIKNNTFVDGLTRAGIVLWEPPNGTIKNMEIENNIFYKTSPDYTWRGHGVDYTGTLKTKSDSLPGVKLSNNLFYSKHGGPAIVNEIDTVRKDNIFDVNPNFVNEVDFQLADGSPAIGTASDGGNIGRY